MLITRRFLSLHCVSSGVLRPDARALVENEKSRVEKIEEEKTPSGKLKKSLRHTS